MTEKDEELRKLADQNAALQLALEEARRELVQSLPEAGASVNFDVQPGKIIANLKVTLRRNTAEQIHELLEIVAALMRDRGWHMAEPAPAAPPPAEPKAAQVARQEGNTDLADKLATPPEVPAPPAGKEWQTFDACFIKILPQPGDTVNIEFYGAVRKQPHDDYPEVKVLKWKFDRAAALLKSATSADVTKAAEFSIACRVFYTIGKEFAKKDGTKGNYRDVEHVRPL